MGFSRNADFEVNDMSDGVVLFDAERNIVHYLNGPATLVWEVAEGRDVDEISAAVAQVMEVPDDEARSIARTGIEQLQRIGGLTP